MNSNQTMKMIDDDLWRRCKGHGRSDNDYSDSINVVLTVIQGIYNGTWWNNYEVSVNARLAHTFKDADVKLLFLEYIFTLYFYSYIRRIFVVQYMNIP